MINDIKKIRTALTAAAEIAKRKRNPLKDVVFQKVNENVIQVSATDCGTHIIFDIPGSISCVQHLSSNTLAKISKKWVEVKNDKIVTENGIMSFPFPNNNNIFGSPVCDTTEYKDANLNNVSFLLFSTTEENVDPSFPGVLFGSSDLVCTDMRRITIVENETGINENVVIPAKEFKIAAKLNINKYNISDNIIFFKNNDDVNLIIRLLKNEFPDYKNLGLLKEDEDRDFIKLNKKELLEKLNFLKSLAKDKKIEAIRLNFEKNMLRITNESGAEATICFLGKFETNREIACNLYYFFEAVKNFCVGENCHVHVEENILRPILLRNSPEERAVHGLMPVRV